MNSDIFNIKRFGSYLGSETRNALSQFGYSGLVCALGSLIVYLFVGLGSLASLHGWSSAGLAPRTASFVLIMVAVLILAPKKIYGSITDKKAGSVFLSIPVSTLEKVLSMIVVSCIFVPLAVLIAYLSVDGILCLIDSNCGASLVGAMLSGFEGMLAKIGELPEELAGLQSLMNPLLYVDDIIQVGLTFLLGSIVFKNSKVAKTILSLMVFGFACSMIMTPIFFHGTIFNVNIQSDAEAIDFINNTFGGFFNHAGLIDTISDTLTNLILITGIYFRVKTLKF
ncbi:MAG: hypothetical protein MJY72_04325 [Bacteroidales bacterium]|nr:hypothetical protein [Bacteroidales bacterium]